MNGSVPFKIGNPHMDAESAPAFQTGEPTIDLRPSRSYRKTLPAQTVWSANSPVGAAWVSELRRLAPGSA